MPISNNPGEVLIPMILVRPVTVFADAFVSRLGESAAKSIADCRQSRVDVRISLPSHPVLQAFLNPRHGSSRANRASAREQMLDRVVSMAVGRVSGSSAVASGFVGQRHLYTAQTSSRFHMVLPNCRFNSTWRNRCSTVKKASRLMGGQLPGCLGLLLIRDNRSTAPSSSARSMARRSPPQALMRCRKRPSPPHGHRRAPEPTGPDCFCNSLCRPTNRERDVFRAFRLRLWAQFRIHPEFGLNKPVNRASGWVQSASQVGTGERIESPLGAVQSASGGGRILKCFSSVPCSTCSCNNSL